MSKRKPRCFTPGDWADYCHGRGSEKTMCVDCTPAYQRDMRADVLCEHPDFTGFGRQSGRTDNPARDE